MITLMYSTINKRRAILKLVYAKNQKEIFSVINIRKTVFIQEQHVDVLEELDHHDYTADHYLLEDKGVYVGTARIIYTDEEAIIGRVAVLKEHRKKGYAKFLITELINIIKNTEYNKIHIGAQKQALPFYQKLGFEVSGDLYYDANIEHYPMELIL